MADGIVLSPSLFDRICRAVRIVERVFGGPGGKLPEKEYQPDATFYNDSGETIPAYGIFWDDDDFSYAEGVPVVNAQKPGTTFSPILYVNGGLEVEAGKYGQYQLGEKVWLAYDTGTPARNDGYGAKPSQFTASKNYPSQFICRGIIDATDKVMLARNLFAIQTLLGKPNANISKGASGTFNIYSGTAGSEAIITSMTVTVFAKGQALTSTKWATAGIINGQWYGFPYEC